MLDDFKTITAINPALKAGKFRDPYGNFMITAAFVWPSDDVIAIAPIVRPLGGDYIRHLHTMPGFAKIISGQVGLHYAGAKLLHVAYQSSALFPLNCHFWMDDQGERIRNATIDDVSNYVPLEILENLPPDDRTRKYLRDLNVAGEKLHSEIITRLGR